MSIDIRRYVDITSGVGGASAVPRRDFILRCVTQNPLVPAGSVVNFSNETDVGNFFGQQSDEYQVALKYFGFVSKQITSPSRLSFIRWAPAALPPAIYGSRVTVPIGSFTAIDNGTLNLLVSGVAVELANIDLSEVTGYPDVASVLQTAIRGSANPQLANATVQFETNRGLFIFTGSVATPGATISAVSGLPTDIGIIAGWNTGLQVEQIGQAAQTAAQAVSNSTSEDDNFGSFAFVGNSGTLPDEAEIIEVAAWNHAQNNKFIFCIAAVAADAGSFSQALQGFSGSAVTLVPGLVAPADHAELAPAEILAATDWDRPAASQNYMYYQFGNRQPTVRNNEDADLYNGLRVNYIGQTQTAGQKIAFYQEGYLMGDSTAAQDMAVYSGEMWLKDSLVAVWMNGFLALPSVPANEDGRVTMLALAQEPIDSALINGVISVGKTLTGVQRAYIGQITGNRDAWRQIESKGYWIDASVTSDVVNGVTKYTLNYILVYGKNDQIRKVTGSNVLI